MPALPHLPLLRVEAEEERRKKGGFGKSPPCDFRQHGEALDQQLATSLADFTQQRLPAGIKPELILRINLANPIDQETWQRHNLTVIGQSDDNTWILFASDNALSDFRQHLDAYKNGPPIGQKSAPYANIFANINDVSRLQATDRIGRLLRADGITQPAQFLDGNTYTLDLELWYTGSVQESRVRLNEIRAFTTTRNGRITDDYVGPALVLARLKATGDIVRDLLTLDAIASIDRPPHVSLRVSQELETSLQDLPRTPQPAVDAPGICIIDSGISSAHPLLGPAVGEATVVSPTITTAADGNGHGTRVAGLALYGDVSKCINERRFIPTLRVFSARVLNDNCEFDEDSLITTQMRNAIEYFHTTYSCRIFNLSLGDNRLPFNDLKVTPWASILDHFAREYDIVIIVAAGNYDDHNPDPNDPATDHLTGYPRYLLKPPARIIEPATGAIVLTVGAVAHNATLPASAADRINLRPIAQSSQPSPFTRSGPGIGGAIKPEVCEYGGNAALDLRTTRVYSPNEMSIVSLSKDYLERLFNADSGTSFAAPRVAHLAAKLVQEFPQASANLIRALIAASANIPHAAAALLSPIDGAVNRLCGYGVPSIDRATASDMNRVTMYASNALPADKFHIYQVPIPTEFYEGSIERRISVTLAFDPPVRHSRLDYIGTTMSFRLYRGKSLDEVAKASKKRADNDNTKSIATPFDCPMDPSPTEREGGTLQRAIFTMKRPGDVSYGATYYLVIRCARQWALDEHFPQKYALVVNLESDALVDIYTQVRERVEQQVRVRPRA